jgi:hypothetical protein
MHTPGATNASQSKIAPPEHFSPLVVLDHSDDRLAVWHVGIGPDRALSRLTGAWMVDTDQVETIRNLAHNRPAVHCSVDVVLPQGITSSMVVDVDATVRSVHAHIDRADKKFSEHQATVRSPLVRPDWPVVHHPAAAPSTARPSDELIERVLTLARGLAELADAWATFEALRLTREYLVDLGGPNARPLPLAEIR